MRWYSNQDAKSCEGPKIQPIGSLLPALHCVQLVTGTPALSSLGGFMAKFTSVNIRKSFAAQMAQAAVCSPPVFP